MNDDTKTKKRVTFSSPLEIGATTSSNVKSNINNQNKAPNKTYTQQDARDSSLITEQADYHAKLAREAATAIRQANAIKQKSKASKEEAQTDKKTDWLQEILNSIPKQLTSVFSNKEMTKENGDSNKQIGR